MGLIHWSLVSPCHSFFPFLSFSLCSSFRMTPWGTGALWIHFFAWASKTQSGRHPASSPGRGHPASSPHREGTYSLREQSKFCARSFIGFLCKPRKIKPLSLPFFLLSLSLMPSSWGYPWILLGLDPGTCGISSDQGLNLCLLHWQANSYPLCHQESSAIYCVYKRITEIIQTEIREEDEGDTFIVSTQSHRSNQWINKYLLGVWLLSAGYYRKSKTNIKRGVILWEFLVQYKMRKHVWNIEEILLIRLYWNHHVFSVHLIRNNIDFSPRLNPFKQMVSVWTAFKQSMVFSFHSYSLEFFSTSLTLLTI